MSSNVIELKPRTQPDEPVIRRDTVADLIASGRTPKHGDFVFSVRYTDDEGHLIVTGPGTGFVVDAAVDTVNTAIRLSYGNNLTVTARGDAVFTWYPAP